MMAVNNQTIESTLLSKKIIKLEDDIINSGRYISAVTEDSFGGFIKKPDGTIIADDPIAFADEVMETAKKIKKYAIEFKTLTDLENDIYNKKSYSK